MINDLDDLQGFITAVGPWSQQVILDSVSMRTGEHLIKTMMKKLYTRRLSPYTHKKSYLEKRKKKLRMIFSALESFGDSTVRALYSVCVKNGYEHGYRAFSRDVVYLGSLGLIEVVTNFGIGADKVIRVKQKPAHVLFDYQKIIDEFRG